MRPEILNPLFAEVEALKGVGPQVAKLLKKLDLTRVVDLLYHLPTGAIERVRAPAATSALLGRNVILDLTPFETRENRARAAGRCGSSRPIGDGNTISLIYFNNPGWAKRSLPMGETRTVSGKLEAYGDEWQIIHPEVAEPGKGPAPALREPVYPLTEGLTNRRLGELARAGARARARAARMDRAEPARARRLARRGARRWPRRIASPAPSRRAGGSPMTRFSPTSSRCCCCASRSGASAPSRLPAPAS